MAPQFLTLASEIRAKIYKHVLTGTCENIWAWRHHYEDGFLLENAAIRKTRAAEHSISLLLVCRQVKAEVGPLYHDLVPLHISMHEYRTGHFNEEMTWLIPFEISALSSASKQVKTLSIPIELPESLESVCTPLDLLAHLPQLKMLIVYENVDTNDVDRSTKPMILQSVKKIKRAKKVLIARIDDYFDQDSSEIPALASLARGPDRTYTIRFQEFLCLDQVCIATLLPGASKVTYEFSPSENAIVKLRKDNDWFLTPEGPEDF